MSINVLRVFRKKTNRTSGDGKGGRRSHDKLGTGVITDPPKQRKGNSLSAPPEVPLLTSPSHQLSSPRKISLVMDSPIHNRPPASPLVTKSSSVGNFRRDSSPATNSTPVPTVHVLSYLDDPQTLDRQDVIDITVDVQNFLAAISRLKQAMEEVDNISDSDDVGREDGTETTDIVLKRLSDLVQVVQTCLGQHSGMQSTEIKNAAMTLMQTYQDCPHRSASMCPGCSNAIESLIDAFTSSVSEYLTGEAVQLPLPQRRGLEKVSLSHSYLKGFSKSHDNLAVKFNSYLDLTQPIGDEAVVDQIDQALSDVHDSVDVASKYLKSRIKYHREVTSYLNKRAQIEARYHQQMSKLCKSTQGALKELSTQEPCLPLMDVFRGSVDQDMKFATNCNATYNFQVGGKITDILEQKNSEYDKRRKEYTQTWAKEEKKLADARSTMKATKAKYEFLGQDLIRVKNLISLDPYGKQADKRKKEAADYESRWQDAEMAYKNTLALCNDCQYQVHVAAKKSILCAYRRIMIDADTQLQNGLETYFMLQHNFFQTLTDPMVQNLAAVQDYSLGSEFMNHISRHPRQAEELEDYLFEEFDPEAAEMEHNGVLSDRAIPNSISNDAFLPGEAPRERSSSPNIHHTPYPPNHEGARSYSQGQVSPRVNRPRPRSIAHLISDTDSKDPRRLSDISGATRDGGANSPPLPLDDDVPMSRNAMAHPFKKLRGPARCRECDTYVYFHGFECETCGLACHRKCLANLAIKCGSKRLARKMNTFGVDFQKHLKATKRYIPIIATECIAELDLRGLDTRGLYRISSAKSKLEHLCQLFETGGDRVDLADRPAHLIGSCLKLYFRQLPEPLLTFALYQDFVTFAREASYILPCKIESLTGEKAESAKKMLDRLKGLLQKLPYENYITLAKLLYHLNRVSSPEHVKNNFMPPSNLGIVFAPNLLRQREMVPSLRLLADMTAQAKVVEIMISHVPEIIHVADDQIMDQDVEVSVNKEVLVDDPVIKSPLLDNDDAMTAESRTPNTTPPERRRENVSELSDVLDALQLVGRRNSQPNISLLKPPHPQLLEVRNSSASISAPVFSNLPLNVGEKDPLTALGRWLRAPATHTQPIEKTLTPVQERQRETDSESSDDENSIIISGSRKLDSHVLSRSESGLSNPSMSWTLFDDNSEVSSLRDSISILSEEENTLPRGFRMNGSNDRKNSKEEIGEAAQLNHKESSQGSDDSSPFVDNNSLFVSADYPTSPMSGPPISILGETEAELIEMNRQKMSIVSIDGGIMFGVDEQTHSPTTMADAERRLFEEFESPESTLKPSKLNRYERYERYRMANPIGDSEVNIEQSQGSTQSTQDSAGTLTDGVLSETDETSPTESQKEYECEDNHNEDESAEGNWEAMRYIHKHIDSGIDERGSPDTRSEKSSSLKRASFPEIIGLRNYRTLVDFNSQESGLAESPDSASLLNEPQPLTVVTRPHSPPDTHTLVTHVLRSPTDPQAQQFMTSVPSAEFASRERRSRSSEPDFEGTRKQSDFEVIVDLNTEQPRLVSNELGTSVESMEDCEADDCLTKSMSAPRSLESATFSSIARNPIQRHSVYDSGMEKRPRASSVEPASPRLTSNPTFSPKHELHYKALTNARSSAAISPTHSASTASSESDLSLPGKSLSKSLNALTSPSPTSSRSGSMKKKKKWGRRLFKPALRILKITPNNSPITANRENIVRDIHLSSHTPEASPSPSEIETDRVRMVSPDSMSTVAKHSSRTMRRSRSCDHLLESSNCTDNVPIVRGSIEVLTEPKSKSKTAKFFSNFKIQSKNKVSPTDETQSAPPKRKKSTVVSPAAENPNKSPKTRKKSRAPHFV